jgi:hypothetical protein
MLPYFRGEGRRGVLSWPAALVFGTVAVLAGSFFTAIAYYAGAAGSWAVEDRQISGFLFVYALTLAGGAPAEIVYAVLLRWLTRLLDWHGAARWVLTGAVLGLAVPWSLSRIGYLIERMYFPSELQRLKAALLFPLVGPMMYAVQPAWVRVSIGAATALSLWVVFRRVSARRRIPRPA